MSKVGKTSAKLTRTQKAAINRLHKLADYWPDGIMLFSNSGMLLVVYEETGEVLASVEIENDGGDPETEMWNDIEYLMWQEGTDE